jgi:hypothetical protein
MTVTICLRSRQLKVPTVVGQVNGGKNGFAIGPLLYILELANWTVTEPCGLGIVPVFTAV